MEISEEILKSIREIPKTIEEEQKSSQRGSQQWNFDVQFDGVDKPDHLSDLSIKVFARQNESNMENFSCGIRLVEKDGKNIMLSRYNGSNHENNVASHECHIHHATPESINRGDRSPEHEDTQTTKRYENLDGAFKCLCEDYSIHSNSPQQNLFEGFLA